SAQRNLELAERMAMESAPPPSRPAYDALLNNCVALSAAGQFDEAVVKFRDAVNLAPQAAEPRIYLALGLIKSNHTREALAELQRAAALDYASANKDLTRARQMAPSDSNLRDFMQRVNGAG
ncbi:MAG: tetratricopeptide repeat protein, partial [Thermoanaerobaculia bacterium]